MFLAKALRVLGFTLLNGFFITVGTQFLLGSKMPYELWGFPMNLVGIMGCLIFFLASSQMEKRLTVDQKLIFQRQNFLLAVCGLGIAKGVMLATLITSSNIEEVKWLASPAVIAPFVLATAILLQEKLGREVNIKLFTIGMTLAVLSFIFVVIAALLTVLPTPLNGLSIVPLGWSIGVFWGAIGLSIYAVLSEGAERNKNQKKLRPE